MDCQPGLLEHARSQGEASGWEGFSVEPDLLSSSVWSGECEASTPGILV